MFGLFSSSNTLYGSTATVEVRGNKATKTYFEHVSQVRRRIEVENLEHLGSSLKGLVQVPDLLTVKYDGDDIVSITTKAVYGYTLNDLREEGYYDVAELALAAAQKAASGVTDLYTDGNIRVEVNSRGKIQRIWIVDVGDIF